MCSWGWREDACPHSPPQEHTFVSNIFIQMGLTKSLLQSGVSPHEIPPWKMGVSRQSKMLEEGPNLLQGPSHRADPLKVVVQVTVKEVTRNCERKLIYHGSTSGLNFYSFGQKY